MKSSTMFRKASESVFKGDHEYACLAIVYTNREYQDMDSPELTAFRQYFKPVNSSGNWFGPVYSPDNQLARQLALLFMAELSKDLEK